MENFTPVSALVGGLLIGASAALFLVLNGRIAGISGILGGLLQPEPRRDRLAPRLPRRPARSRRWSTSRSAARCRPSASTLPLPLLVVAGLIVGFGTPPRGGLHQRPWRLRHRPRLAALASRPPLVFMATAIATVFSPVMSSGCKPCPLILSAFASGLLFGLGLIVSQMVNPAKVLGFLDIFGNWDPSLAFVMGGAVAVSALGYRHRQTARRSRAGAAPGDPDPPRPRSAPDRRGRPVRHRLGPRRPVSRARP